MKKKKKIKNIKKEAHIDNDDVKITMEIAGDQKKPLDSEDEIMVEIAGDPKIESIYPENEVEITKIFAGEPKIKPIYPQNEVQMTKVIAGEPKPIIHPKTRSKSRG